MALTAVIDGRYMVNGFSNADDAVVTCRAVIHDALVIKSRTDKGGGVMAYRAVFRRRKMIKSLPCGDNAIVA